MGRPRKPKEHAAVATAEELQTALTNGQIPEPEPGNETAPDARQRRKRKQTDLPGVSGPGVSTPEDGELDALLDELKTLQGKRSKLSEKIGDLDRRAGERMKALNLTSYRYEDKLAKIVPGKEHVKVVTVDASTNGDTEDEE